MNMYTRRLQVAVKALTRDLDNIQQILNEMHTKEATFAEQTQDLHNILTELEQAGEPWRARQLAWHIRISGGIDIKERRLAHELSYRGWRSSRIAQGIIWTPPTRS